MRKADLIALARSTGFPRISIYIPTHLSYPSIEQDPIRLSTALKEADQQLAASGLRRPDIDGLLGEARGRVPASMFWRYQDKGLAVLIEKGATHWVKLPHAVPELVVVSPRYHLWPMIRMFRNGDQFHLLAMTRDSVRFFDGRERELREVAVEGMPAGIAEIMARTEFNAYLGFHARDRGDPASGGDHGKFHALGVSPEDYETIELGNLLRDVGKAIDRHLAGSEQPLVIAAKARLGGHLRKHIAYRHVAPEVIQSDPVAVGDEVLQAEAWRIAEPIVRADRETARQRLRAKLDGADIAGAKEVQSLLRAAMAGRVDCVFLAADANVWGYFDEAHQVLRIDPQSGPDNEDVLNRLAVETLMRGGDVFTLPEDLRDRAGPAAGLYRY
ncbi:MAG: hypothetical protein KJZ80_09920 [Hyphomicrobiaceae bacterium]|nr:hypothetical protein [Hyphomicrobiaceae bacterium]